MPEVEFKRDIVFVESAKSSSKKKSEKKISKSASDENDLQTLRKATQKLKEPNCEVLANDHPTKSAKKKPKRKASNKVSENTLTTEKQNQCWDNYLTSRNIFRKWKKKRQENTDLQIEGVNYIIKSAKKKNKKDSPNKIFNAKLSSNMCKHENFGQCIMYKWIDKIEEVLKKDIEEMKRNPPTSEEPPPVRAYQFCLKLEV
ncbi:hypothetical protein Avbf_09557 [Armadillidium vulgare]|nr:hypothetical protein Avbf_09557 [Armadillidium vulgare]